LKTALFCLTAAGYNLALKIKQSLALQGEQADLYAPGKEFARPEQTIIFSSLAAAVAEAFSRYHRIILIMALGIVVRMIAPHIKDKHTDPAVVVLDEAGEHVISVLSGHLGGANELARLIATLTGARPVITTATDVHGLPAVDDLARVYNLAMDPPTTAKVINTALVNGSTVCFYAPTEITRSRAPGIEYRSPGDYPHRCADVQYHVVVTNRIPDREEPHTVFLRPRNLVAGVGCRSGTADDQIMAALNTALELCRCSPLSLRALATIDVKEKEPGLRSTANRLQLPLVVFSSARINQFLQHAEHNIALSEFVHQKVGAPAVCEPAALLASRKGELLLPKHKFQGITIAVAEDQ